MSLNLERLVSTVVASLAGAVAGSVTSSVVRGLAPGGLDEALGEWIASTLASIEHAWSEYQARIYERLEGGPVRAPPRIMVPRIDPCRLAAMFLDDRGWVHLVWECERVPVPVLSRLYDEVRKRIFGRIADVESVFIGGSTARYPGTSSILDPIYEMSIHADTTEPYTGTIYVNTWNHMMSSLPSPGVLLRGGWREAKPEVMRGDRDDAEEYAKSLG